MTALSSSHGAAPAAPPPVAASAPAVASGALRAAFLLQRWRWADVLLLALLVGGYLLAERHLALATGVLVAIIFALSLDLAQGYGGIETLGHAAFFGAGAYAAGLYAMHVSPEPFSGLGAAALAAALLGLVSALAIVRAQGLTQIMLTLAVATVVYELANVFKGVTGGDDGLSGFDIAPLFGRFAFDLFGHTGYWYAAGVLLVVYAGCKWLVNAPFGLTVQGIRENPVRMRMLGVPVAARLVGVYTLSAAIAGLAGGLSAQVNRIVGLDALSFTVSANVLVMLALGGTGRLYGAFFGAIVFVLLSDRAAVINPTYWLAALGVLLILVVRFAPRGLSGGLKGLR